ncbi:hypothetical protein IHE45_12G071400 [Dioscorea alata]|uniref:Uncharacterized protein n=1 Tax=Dioscorea alata TaxID=55571 RepID=A0ACB7V2P3_DIOAL|nr:hypothetical protein IHE45_12G071400 [Dioscorea alata]
MDLHSTAFPGKSKASANKEKKDGDRNTKITNSRPKPAFGVPRSTNIPARKSLLSKRQPSATSRPSKPVESLTKLGLQKNNKGEATVDDGKNASRNRFQKLQQEITNQDFEKQGTEMTMTNGEQNMMQTPVSLVKSVAPETPYQSAKNCTKCRLDRLESSSYWLAQIKLAESVGKHFISATFFRLALDCHAEPFSSLHSELKQYIQRHGAVSKDALWDELCRLYGFRNDSPEHDLDLLTKNDFVLVEHGDPEFDETCKDGFWECDHIVSDTGNALVKDPLKIKDANKPKVCLFERDSLDGKPMGSSYKGSVSTCVRGDHESELCREKHKRIPVFISNKSSSQTKEERSARRNEAGAIAKQSSQSSNMVRTDGKHPLGENSSSIEFGETTTNKS